MKDAWLCLLLCGLLHCGAMRWGGGGGGKSAGNRNYYHHKRLWTTQQQQQHPRVGRRTSSNSAASALSVGGDNSNIRRSLSSSERNSGRSSSRVIQPYSAASYSRYQRQSSSSLSPRHLSRHRPSSSSSSSQRERPRTHSISPGGGRSNRGLHDEQGIELGALSNCIVYCNNAYRINDSVLSCLGIIKTQIGFSTDFYIGLLSVAYLVCTGDISTLLSKPGRPKFDSYKNQIYLEQ
jgi:hypothetical protein